MSWVHPLVGFAEAAWVATVPLMRPYPLAQSLNPDLPDVLLHMTGRHGERHSSLLSAIAEMSPASRLGSILDMRTLWASNTFDTWCPVVCFTQTTRRAMASLNGRRFDGVGIAFHVQPVFDEGGGPALYVRGDEYDELHGSPTLSVQARSRMVRYWPGARPAQDTDPPLPRSLSGISEWLHEREWRLPRPASVTGDWGWKFQPEHVAFVLVPNATVLQELITDLGQRRAANGTDHTWLKGVPVASIVGSEWVFKEGLDVAAWT